MGDTILQSNSNLVNASVPYPLLSAIIILLSERDKVVRKVESNLEEYRGMIKKREWGLKKMVVNYRIKC